MSLEFNLQSYAQLLATVAPQVIETEAEYDRLLAIVERLMFSERTPKKRLYLGYSCCSSKLMKQKRTQWINQNLAKLFNTLWNLAVQGK
jgi:hypothetical protein